jgi:hypothetical protein
MQHPRALRRMGRRRELNEAPRPFRVPHRTSPGAFVAVENSGSNSSRCFTAR